MAGHRRNQEHLRIVLAALPSEAKQLTEGRPQNATFLDWDRFAVTLDAVDAVIGPGVGEAGQCDELVIGCHPPPWGRERVRRPGVQDRLSVFGRLAHAIMNVGYPLIGVIYHERAQPPGRSKQTMCQTDFWHVAC